MTDAPERIWAWPSGDGWGHAFASKRLTGPRTSAEYVRADIYAAALAEVERLRAALEHVRIELACLIPVPSNPKTEDWPVGNPADAACLQFAYGMVKTALDDKP
jgi:hypothetical protein